MLGERRIYVEKTVDGSFRVPFSPAHMLLCFNALSYITLSYMRDLDGMLFSEWGINIIYEIFSFKIKFT